jgi:hypothetical protein
MNRVEDVPLLSVRRKNSVEINNSEMPDKSPEVTSWNDRFFLRPALLVEGRFRHAPKQLLLSCHRMIFFLDAKHYYIL